MPQFVMLFRRWAQLQCLAGRTSRTACYCVAGKRAQYRNIRPFQINLRSQILVLSPYLLTSVGAHLGHVVLLRHVGGRAAGGVVVSVRVWLLPEPVVAVDRLIVLPLGYTPLTPWLHSVDPFCRASMKHYSKLNLKYLSTNSPVS